MKTCQFLCYLDSNKTPKMVNLSRVEYLTRLVGGDKEYTLLRMTNSPDTKVPHPIQDVLRAMKDPKFAKMIGIEVV